ncbi:hypothetical protein Taro_043851 [Colocasia esculenta]|uniref:Ionotropic glutamate receptor C-terminal domain-containing protein n=1 Tax=Colocasia esculenta TaxID=4460 RepID=A0A843WKF2_COLES|nr:hypothetical protein [Colocasia esculenta]
MRNPGLTHLSTFFVFLLFLFTFLRSCSSQASAPAKTGEDGGFNGSTSATKFRVGVILDLATPVGKEGLRCMEMARADFYAAHPEYKSRLELVPRDSNRDTVTAASAAVDLLKNERVQAIVGPQTSDAAVFVADIGNKSQVPVVSFSATSPSLSPEKTPYFVRTGVNDSSQASAIAALVSAFGWKQVVPIYEDSQYGAGAMPSLVDAIKGVGARVPYRCVLPVKASDDYIAKELYKLVNMEGRVFLVQVSRALAVRLFAKANEAQMMAQGFSWIIAEGLTSLMGAMEPSVLHDSMQGVLGVRPYVNSKSERLRQFNRRWRREHVIKDEGPDSYRPSVLGLWAYDTIWALATAAENVGAADPGYTRPPGTAADDSNDLAALGVSATGPRLLQAIRSTDLNNGLSGPFRLVDGQLQAPAFEVVNVNDRTERSIGFWTAECGLMRHLSLSCSGSYSTSMANLGPVIWPGESKVLPKGWVTPMMGKTLRVLIPGPVLPGFHSFLKAERDPVTNETVVGGYVIEVFEEAMKALPYAVLFEYITLQKNGKSAGNYDYLVQQVYQQKYDALVGDVTITANRYNFVDFTLPYTASGVSMVVPYRDDRSNSAWIFLKPLTTNLWLISAAFFVFTGGVVWILEHRINDDFRGPPAQQCGTVFYFIFSTLVFSHSSVINLPTFHLTVVGSLFLKRVDVTELASMSVEHRITMSVNSTVLDFQTESYDKCVRSTCFYVEEKMMSNLSRMVVIIWVFVVLILQSSYTASLTSMLTVKHLRPTVTELRNLVNTTESVGHLKNSFTKRTLVGMGFQESRLIPFRSPQEYQEALSKGTKGGGVAAVVDEIPYLKVFLKDYCSDYTMAGSPSKAGGFGFAFPKGSPLVPDLSRAILNITEGDKMVEIEKRWFGDQSNCPSKDSDLTSGNLSMASFWGLFLITGIASVASLLVFLFSFVYHHLHLLRNDPGSGQESCSGWEKVKALSRHYDQKDLSSYTFRKAAKNAGDDHTATPYTNRTTTTAMASPYTDRSGQGEASASPRTVGSQSPWSVHYRTFGGSSPPPEPASPLFHESSTSAVEMVGLAAVEDMFSAEIMSADLAPEASPVSSGEMPID